MFNCTYGSRSERKMGRRLRGIKKHSSVVCVLIYTSMSSSSLLMLWLHSSKMRRSSGCKRGLRDLQSSPHVITTTKWAISCLSDLPGLGNENCLFVVVGNICHVINIARALLAGIRKAAGLAAAGATRRWKGLCSTALSVGQFGATVRNCVRQDHPSSAQVGGFTLGSDNFSHFAEEPC